MAYLCTLEDIRIRLPDKLSMSALESGSFNAFREDASDFAETYCDRTFLSGSLGAEVFDGLGFDDTYSYAHTSYQLEQAPITTSPNAPRLYNYSANVWTLVDNDDFKYDATNGIIYLAGSSDYVGDSSVPGQLGGTGAYFANGKNNYKVEYYYGYADVNALPKDLRSAVARLAIWYAKDTPNLGTIDASSADGRSYTYYSSIPKSITRVFDKYKL